LAYNTKRIRRTRDATNKRLNKKGNFGPNEKEYIRIEDISALKRMEAQLN